MEKGRKMGRKEEEKERKRKRDGRKVRGWYDSGRVLILASTLYSDTMCPCRNR